MPLNYILFMSLGIGINIGAGAWNLADGKTIGALNLGLAAFMFSLLLVVVIADAD